MAHVIVTVNARKYDILCDDGQEAHLRRLAEYVDKRVGELLAAVGQVGDAKLLLMASLLLADELSDAYDEIRAVRPQGQGRNEGGNGGEITDHLDARLGAPLEKLADRIEAIARTLERL